MPLKISKGNMYPWVTHTHTHLGGECPHKCTYCYVDNPRFGRPAKFKGPIRLIEEELLVKYGIDRTIFIEHQNDLFAIEVPDDWIHRIVHHCREWPQNTYVLQTKNPIRYLTTGRIIPLNSILGCTIETNRDVALFSKAPPPVERLMAMQAVKAQNHRIFITIEPIMDFDVCVLGNWLVQLRPEFVNIGADSKGHNLPEPPPEKVKQLIDILNDEQIEIREKHNLERLFK